MENSDTKLKIVKFKELCVWNNGMQNKHGIRELSSVFKGGSGNYYLGYKNPLIHFWLDKCTLNRE